MYAFGHVIDAALSFLGISNLQAAMLLILSPGIFWTTRWIGRILDFLSD